MNLIEDILEPSGEVTGLQEVKNTENTVEQSTTENSLHGEEPAQDTVNGVVQVSESNLELGGFENWVDNDDGNVGEVLVSTGILNKIQAAVNRNPCIAYQLQLSVRAALSYSRVKNTISDVRRTCLFFRKSIGGWEVLCGLQKQPTRCALFSTLLHAGDQR